MINADIFQYVDLTYLGEDKEDALACLDKAKTLKPAAVCISRPFVPLAKETLHCPIASVVNFPSGEESEEKVLADIQHLIEQGIDEIDMVFPYQTYLHGEEDMAFKQFEIYLNAIPQHILKKVIIETGKLKDPTLIKSLCERLTQYPIDFIKTSTGKTPIGATEDSATIILSCIKESNIGLKVSGGIRTLEEAKMFLSLSQDYFKKIDLPATRFRIGASQLSDSV